MQTFMSQPKGAHQQDENTGLEADEYTRLHTQQHFKTQNTSEP